VPAVVGFVTAKPNDEPAVVVVLADGNNDVVPPKEKRQKKISFVFFPNGGIYQN